MAFLQLSRWGRLSGILLLLLCLSSASTYGHSFVFSATTLSKIPPDGRREMATTGLLRVTSMPSSVYVNIPFCRRRCFYCDFPIKVVGDRPGAASAAAKPYVDALLREMRATAASLRARDTVSEAGSNSSPDMSSGWDGVSTLFFGGGTPSLCPPELVGSLLDTVRECFGIADGAEISIEMDPGTFDEERLGAFLDLGVTRVSMGVQSFDAGLLEACGRAHSLADVYEAVELLRRSGLQNFSIDVMSGLPGQTMEQWEHTLSEAISTGAAHISVYDLQVEARTAFGRWFTPGQTPLPKDETCADMYRRASVVLGGAGYTHYEISNYARSGFESRHNRAYWENVPFLAFGNGAASYVDGRRFSRPRGLSDYDRWVDELAARGWEEATATTDDASPRGTGLEDVELSREAQKRDALYDDVMLGFRLREGLDLDALASEYGTRAAEMVKEGCKEGVRQGWVMPDDIDETSDTLNASGKVSFGNATDGAGGAGSIRCRRGTLRLSDPEGFLFSNSVISSVFCKLDDWQAS